MADNVGKLFGSGIWGGGKIYLFLSQDRIALKYAESSIALVHNSIIASFCLHETLRFSSTLNI